MTHILAARVGAHLYGLDTQSSDHNYVYYVKRSQHELGTLLSQIDDPDTHKNIGFLRYEILEQDIDTLAMLYSPDIEFGQENKDEIKKIISLRREIVRMNIPLLYTKTLEKINRKISRINQPDPEILELQGKTKMVEDFGYDIKEASHVYRLLTFLINFYESRFGDFEGSIKLGKRGGVFVLMIKKGAIDKETYQDMQVFLMAQVLGLKTHYQQVHVNNRTQNKIEQIFDRILNNS